MPERTSGLSSSLSSGVSKRIRETPPSQAGQSAPAMMWGGLLGCSRLLAGSFRA
jgi:hypothetical protein